MLVLKDGEVEEYGTPRDLLTKDQGYFRDMVMDNGQDYYKEMIRLVEEQEEGQKQNEDMNDYFRDLP